MLTWLATAAAGRFGKFWLGGAILGCVMLTTTAGILAWQLSRCEAVKDSLTTENGRLAGEVVACSGQMDKLREQIDGQNAAIAALRKDAEEREGRARDAVEQELNSQPARPPETATADEYNRWMRELVCSVARCRE